MANAKHDNVSIRLESDGHTFSPECAAASGAVEVVVSTVKTALVPAELFVEDDARAALAAVGFAPTTSERVVYSAAVSGVVAVMAMDVACYDALVERYGQSLCFSSPLLERVDIKRGVHLKLDRELLYVRVYDDVMLFAEVVEVKSDGDILYYLESIHRVYDIYNMYARATGDTGRLKRLCGRSFKNLETGK
ncbi:MAG: DUF3822 family protein [Alistipes sp.]|nr:DUF3822 family protein [Alistipes sp.]